MQVSLQYAAEHLDELAAAADNGEVVEIARHEKPALKLIASENVSRVETTGAGYLARFAARLSFRRKRSGGKWTMSLRTL